MPLAVTELLTNDYIPKVVPAVSSEFSTPIMVRCSATTDCCSRDGDGRGTVSGSSQGSERSGEVKASARIQTPRVAILQPVLGYIKNIASMPPESLAKFAGMSVGRRRR